MKEIHIVFTVLELRDGSRVSLPMATFPTHDAAMGVAKACSKSLEELAPMALVRKGSGGTVQDTGLTVEEMLGELGIGGVTHKVRSMPVSKPKGAIEEVSAAGTAGILGAKVSKGGIILPS